MWLLLLIIILPLLILAIVEELKEFFVNRYVLGPASWEGKVRVFFHKVVDWMKKKLKKVSSTG